MRILYLSYENYIELEDKHPIMYLNINHIAEGVDWKAKIDSFAPELVLEREFNDAKAIYDDVYAYLDEKHPDCKKAMWFIDTHVGYERHMEYAKHFDYIFVAISKFVDDFKKINPKSYWLPVCYPYTSKEITMNRSPILRDVVFVGNYEKIRHWFPERAEYIDFLKEHYGDRFSAFTDYEQMKYFIKTAKVSFNYAVRDDMNFRVFETLGLGTELVTNDVEDLHKIKGLTDRINIFRDRQDCVNIIDSILDNKSDINALANQKWIINNHCLIHRYKSLLKMVVSGFQEEF